jgi:arylsulfatase A
MKNQKRNLLLTPGVVLALAGAVLPACSPGSGDAAPQSPNIVFILADDLGWAQTSVYGSTYYQTPNIDRLAAEGVRFTNAYSAAAICSPTRASIMTGKYPARLGLTDFIPGANREGTLLQQPEWQKYLPLDEITIAEILRERGYRTAMFGKWHLSKTKFGPESLPHYPDKQGFDDYFVIDKPERSDNPEADPHKSDSIGNTSVRFLHENAHRPFFLYASFSAIHNPLMDSAEEIARWEKTEGSEKPENHPVIAAMLGRMDRNIGKILDALDALDLAENTIVIFYSDNGGLAREALQTPFAERQGMALRGRDPRPAGHALASSDQ